jgi:hypothetical protein
MFAPQLTASPRAAAACCSGSQPVPPPRRTAAAYTQADRERELAAIRAEEEEALCGALSRQAAAEDAAAREVQRLREESAELRE